MGRIHHWAAALALAATGAAVPMQAQAHCWTTREASAAQLREMQTMLMVAALRCRAARMDITADYDDFVASQREMLAHANIVIKQHFAAEGATQADYDRFATSLANGFGDDQTTEGSCAEAAMLAHDASMVSPAALEPMAAARLFPVTLPGGYCSAEPGPVMTAAAAPFRHAEPVPEFAPEPAPLAPPDAPPAPLPVAMAAALPIVRPDPAPIVPIDKDAEAAPQPAVVALAPPPPKPQGLPADVLAAMAVLARYQASVTAAAPAAQSAPTVLATAQH